jgi:pimeloyl-ACP methyl ester carboxylesterase
MSSGFVKTSDGAERFYKNWAPRDAPMLFFLAYGYRVVAHDPRGHGRFSQTGTGHAAQPRSGGSSGCARGRFVA